MEKKSLENFDRHFKYALAITKIKYSDKSSIYLNYHDLRNACYVVYHASKEDNGVGSYKSYIVSRLTGAIKDYRIKVLKINKRTGVVWANRYDDIDDFKDTLTSETDTNLRAEQIACDVLGNGLLTRREKTVFILYFLEDMTLLEIADIFGLTEPYISQWKIELCKKLKNLYKEK